SRVGRWEEGLAWIGPGVAGLNAKSQVLNAVFPMSLQVSWGAPEPTAGNKKPTGCLLGACSGRTTGGTVSPYSPCCFQEYLPDLNTGRKKSFAPAQFFFCSTKLIALRDLVGYRRWPGSH